MQEQKIQRTSKEIRSISQDREEKKKKNASKINEEQLMKE